MYATFVSAGTNYVFDACAGPCVGNISHSDYLKTTIDQSTDEERALGYFTFPSMLVNYFRNVLIDADQPTDFQIE